MPVTISVSQVRQALFLGDPGADARGDGSPSTSLLGQWFHEGLSFLVDGEAGASPLAQLGELDADLDLWKQTLAERAYAQFVGPRLTAEQAALRSVGPQVMAFWQGMQAASHWLAELSWALRSQRPSQRKSTAPPWRSFAEFLSTEEPLRCDLREPGWTDAVRLTGIADAVVRLAPADVWCVIEFKLGRTSPAADLGQACLYHLMLSRMPETRGGDGSSTPSSSDAGALALVSFRPDRHERIFKAEELQGARARLIDLIGKLAGVAGSPANEPSAPKSEPKPAPKTAGTTGPSEAHLELGRSLVARLADYGVHVTLDHPIVAGPRFVRFPVELGPRTTVKSVARFAAELQVRLRLDAEPFIDRADGRLVIDVQRPDPQTIFFSEVRSKLPPPDPATGGSSVPVGVDLHQRLVCADLAKPEHAHLLVAGTTGSGKSEWLRLAVAGLIATNTPATLRFLVIDPKRNAFHALRASPFLWRPLVFPDEQSVVEILMELAEEMDRRYRIADGADSFIQLAGKSDKPLPRIVCLCDEYRDLISRDRKERKLIEQQICRLGAKARAAGIHLILATQEPSRDTIAGPLDSNMPARVGLKMGKHLESRMLLNQAGAERLLGHGDLLFKDIGQPRRLQAPFVPPEERDLLFGAIS